jgi:hypothetical protein
MTSTTDGYNNQFTNNRVRQISEWTENMATHLQILIIWEHELLLQSGRTEAKAKNRWAHWINPNITQHYKLALTKGHSREQKWHIPEQQRMRWRGRTWPASTRPMGRLDSSTWFVKSQFRYCCRFSKASLAWQRHRTPQESGPPPIEAIRTRIGDLSGVARQVECDIVA